MVHLICLPCPFIHSYCFLLSVLLTQHWCFLLMAPSPCLCLY
uniref:Uncharacterized protein n=1 Tax=Anguilla anguilla TaxID=7936 RepID=A0A0E9XGJ3_ANGAN